LRRKAFASNILLEATASAMTDDEICQFIFIPGLSTAGEVNMNAGRGVGMSIVKESVESRGGTISVSSEAGRGTEFVIRIPHFSPFSHIIPAAPNRTGSCGFDVLIVDDSPSIREHTAQTVRNAGWKVVTANNGREALEILENTEPRPSIILTDLEMPEMDGYNLVEKLKTDSRYAGIPVVMITSRNDERYQTKAFELGVNAYITKPFDDVNLIQIVSSLFKPNR
jgi:CheY-like chemotaxis protein